MKAKEPATTPVGGGVVEDRRQRKARETREALAGAALGLVLERGLAATTVEAIAERADVTRRTFSRHFTGKEDAALDVVRADGQRINAELRARPAGEGMLASYRAAVRSWLSDPERPAEHVRPRVRELLKLVVREPALFAAYERIRVDAQEESVRILAGRHGGGPDAQARAVVAVGAAAGTLTAALRLWVRAEDGAGAAEPSAAELSALVERAFGVLTEEAATAAGASSATSTTSTTSTIRE
jgi:AcrR family transcriptional regulator